MRGNLDKCLRLIFGSEGGFVNNPKDPGGATKYGITAATLGAWRKLGRAATPDEVKRLQLAEAAAILEGQYARSIRFDDLPAGIDYAVLDFAVNSGPGQAAKTLQRVLGVPADGIIGERTLQAIRAADSAKLIDAYLDARLAFLKRLKTWPTFGKGWSRRLAEVRDGSLRMADGRIAITPPADGAQKADPADTKATATESGKGSIIATIGVATTTVTATTDKLAPMAGGGNKLIDYAFTGLTVLGVVLTIAGVALAARGQLKALRSGAPV
ncbi:MAG: glycosyl hydrolase 108 family protein [Candidatus Kaistia colombiensis]|nr:MAG: glycosyl hydrolase 108 family protein [Kaistia sp.]